MRKPKEIHIYGFTGFDDEPKFYTVNRKNYKITNGKGYGAFHEYDNFTVVKNKNPSAYESIILSGRFSHAKSWQELELLSTLFYNA